MTEKEIILMHIKQYPMMQIEDLFKLFHQASFGPAHFNKLPSLNLIMKYLDEELSSVDDHHDKPSVTQIGHAYVRIDLLAVTKGEITQGDLAQVFYKAATDARPKRRYFHAFSDRTMVWLARSCPRVFKKLFMTALNYLGNRALKKRK